MAAALKSNVLVSIAKLFRSHAELCKALRLAGRELLQFRDANSRSLARIRGALDAAESVRKEVRSADRLLKQTVSSQAHTPTKKLDQRKALEKSQSEPNRQTVDQIDSGNARRRHHRTRTNSRRVLKFPARRSVRGHS